MSRRFFQLTGACPRRLILDFSHLCAARIMLALSALDYETKVAMLKTLFALHASLAYLGMLTGFGMLFFTLMFFFLVIDGAGLSAMLRWPLAYLLFVTGPGALVLAAWFYGRIKLESGS